MTLIELSSKPGQLSHDLNEITLSLRIFELHLFFLLHLLLQFRFQHVVLLQSVSQFDLIFEDNPTSDLLMDRLSI